MDLSVLTVPMLKNECKARGLPISGAKAVLIGRIEEYEAAQEGGDGGSVPAATPAAVAVIEAKEGGGEAEGGETEEEEYLKKLKVPELKELLEERGLTKSGRKADLIERLLSN